jgi:hypothetical protein
VRAGLCRQQGGPSRNRRAQRPHAPALRCTASVRGVLPDCAGKRRARCPEPRLRTDGHRFSQRAAAVPLARLRRARGWDTGPVGAQLSPVWHCGFPGARSVPCGGPMPAGTCPETRRTIRRVTRLLRRPQSQDFAAVPWINWAIALHSRAWPTQAPRSASIKNQ